jgi:hypothetical protein
MSESQRTGQQTVYDLTELKVKPRGQSSLVSLGDHVSGWVNVRSIGAEGDGVTDDLAAFNAAHDALPASGGRIRIPGGDFRLSGQWVITKPVVIEGSGSSFPGAGFTGATRLIFDEDVAGIYVATTARGSRFASFNLIGTYDAATTSHGLHIRAQSGVFDQVVVSGFGGHGVFIEADGTNDPETGTATLAHFNRLVGVKSRSNRGDGFRVQGLATYVNHFDTTDASANGGWGYAMVSNHQTLISPHANANTTGAYWDNGNSNRYFAPYVEPAAGEDTHDLVRFDTDASSSTGAWYATLFARPLNVEWTGASHRDWHVETLGGTWEKLVIHDFDGPVSDTEKVNAKTFALENGFSTVGHIRLRETTTNVSIWDASAVRFDVMTPLTIGAGALISGHLSGVAVWDPGSIADGAVASTTVTVTGAVVGNTVVVGFTTAVPAGALLVGAVTAPGVVSVTLFNKTGAPLDLASGTVRADVWKHG